jgi:hypothetical protein
MLLVTTRNYLLGRQPTQPAFGINGCSASQSFLACTLPKEQNEPAYRLNMHTPASPQTALYAITALLYTGCAVERINTYNTEVTFNSRSDGQTL